MDSTQDSARRRFLALLAASPLLYGNEGGFRSFHAREVFKPSWSPHEGHTVSISYPAMQHPRGPGATLAEISPQFQAWNPFAPTLGPYACQGYRWNSIYGYCGAAWNEDTRQLICYNSGHVGANASAPFCFDLNDLRWKWLDVPLPHDSLSRLSAAGIAYVENIPGDAQAVVATFYPPEQYNYHWGDFNGSWSGWPTGYRQPGKIQPLPSHTYGNRVCIPAAVMGNNKGGFLTYGRYEGCLNSSNANGSHLFNLDTQTWVRGANHWPGGASNGHGARCDKLTGKVIAFGGFQGSFRFVIFDPATRLWTTKKQNGAAASTNTDQPGVNIHDAARLFIVPRQIQVSGQNASWQRHGTWYKFFAVDVDAVLGTETATFVQLHVKEQGGWPLNDFGNNEWIGWSYCPEDECLYAINGVEGSNKYWRLAPPRKAVSQQDYLSGTWTLTEHLFLSGSLKSPGEYTKRSMMYNRLNWDKLSGSFVWFPDSIDGPVQAFRPKLRTTESETIA
jgi:hypothetical protein